MSYVDLVIYTSCYSARGGSSSVAGLTEARGATATVGYVNTVSMGEWYSKYLLYCLEQGYTLSQSIARANDLFLLDTATSKVEWESDPTNSANRRTFGNSSLTLGG